MRSKNKYPLSQKEAEENAAGALTWLIYIVLGFVILITAVHAITLVTLWTQMNRADGLFQWIMSAIRIASPVVVEAAAIVAGLGFVKSKWRGGQRTVGWIIEGTWVLFAAANLTTVFALEHGDPLQSWQAMWIRYGLPLSAIVAGILVYMLLRADPAHQRANERALAEEQQRADEFNATNTVLASDAMSLIRQRREWRNVINQLAAEGYTPEEIEFITQYLPGLTAVPLAAPAFVPAPQPKQSLVDRARATLGLLAQPEHNYTAGQSEEHSEQPTAAAGQREPAVPVPDRPPAAATPAPSLNGQEATAGRADFQ